MEGRLSSKVQIVCGIDPGLRRTGYGILRINDYEDTVDVLDAGVIRCAAEGALAIRLAELAAGLDEVLNEHRIDAVAVEQIYSHYQRPRTAILMAHARGVILLEAARRNIHVLHLPSTTVKRNLTGNGRASKEQMQRAVMTVLSLDQIPEPPDVADALAIALCASCVLRKPARQMMLNDDLMSH
jgi:crossover junction endodeoxyribonuclease RuvC